MWKKLDGRYRIIIFMVILELLAFLIPYILGNYIDSKRNVWESDRNFYGKSININDIHLKENTSEEFSVTSKEFKKVKTNGKIYYYLEQDGNEISVSTKEYLKYVADCDEVTLYKKKGRYTYRSSKGKIKATVTGNEIYFYKQKFSEEELTKIKNAIWKECKNTVFVNGYNDNEIGAFSKHYDRKKQPVCTDFSFEDKNTDTSITVVGNSLIKQGKYDWLYPDEDIYVKETNTKHDLKDKILHEVSKMYYDWSDNSMIILLMMIVLTAGFVNALFESFQPH